MVGQLLDPWDSHRGGPATQQRAGRRRPGPQLSRGRYKGGSKSNRRCGHRPGSCSSRTGCPRASLWNSARCFVAGNLFVCGILCSEPCGTKSSGRDPGTPGSHPSPEVKGESHGRKRSVPSVGQGLERGRGRVLHHALVDALLLHDTIHVVDNTRGEVPPVGQTSIFLQGLKVRWSQTPVGRRGTKAESEETTQERIESPKSRACRGSNG